jgi:hypothetical protein
MLKTQIANDFIQYPRYIANQYDEIKKKVEDLGLQGKEFTARDIGIDCGATMGMLKRYGVVSKVGRVETAPLAIDVSETMDYLIEGVRYRAKPRPYGYGYELEKPYDHSWEVRRLANSDKLVRRYKVDHITIIPKVNVYRFPFATRESFAQNIADNIKFSLLN